MADAFCWYELMTTDAAGAGAFYKRVVGWTIHPMDGSPVGYSVLQTPSGAGIGGLYTLPPEALSEGARPSWLGYVAVADVDAGVAKVMQLGGRVMKPAEDIPTIGRFAIVADPFGAAFILFRPDDRESQTPTGPGVGFVAWRELMAGELDPAWAFYEALFGWTKSGVHDMGPRGAYQLFRTGGDADAGGMMTKPASLPASFWTYYFTVDGIRAATVRIKEGGGAVINGPMQVPTGDWVVQGIDPQGAMFALFSTAE